MSRNLGANDRLRGRARHVYRIDRVKYFRCLGCGYLGTASTIGRHVDACFAKDGAEEKPHGEQPIRLPYRDD